MSNTNVGVVYQQIIKDVVESSRIDFEEGGVEEGVLEELSKGWQAKLSHLGVAQFPWDPKPEPPPTPMVNPAPPNNGINYQQNVDTPPMSQPQPSLTLPPLPPMHQQIPVVNNNAAPHIKTEPGLENGVNPPQPNYNGINMPSATTAQQRAAQNLQASYGARAAASINAIHGLPQQGSQPQSQQLNMPAPQQQQSPPQQRPPAQANRPQMTPAQYQQVMAQQAAAARQQLQSGQNGLGNAQTDGSSDEVSSYGVLKQMNSQGMEVELGRVEIDNIIRRKIEERGQAMEGGGLMLPLQRHVAPTNSRKRKIGVNPEDSEGNLPLAGPSSAPQYDGGDDDDDDDEDKTNVLKAEDDDDAINSDLDDPNELAENSDDEDDGTGHIMLCMYDKVQRVKNKWKCVMKDGVLTVNGKEYVFHKASGEYEW